MKYLFDIEARHFRDSTDFVFDCPLKRSFKENFGLDCEVGLSKVNVGDKTHDVVCIVDDRYLPKGIKYNEFNYDLLYNILNKNKFVNKNINGSIEQFKDLIKRKKKVGKITIILT